jgi:branched-chain amino acid transport system substrate-binding protein
MQKLIDALGRTVISRRLALFALLAPGQAFAQKAGQPVKVGFPMILSGPGALFGEPALKGAQMYVQELNAAGGVLGRPIELIQRDTKGNADEAVRVSRELILKDNVDFLVGTLTSAEGPAVSTIAKENKIVFIAPIPKTDQLTAPANLHPYVFRTASNTTIEGRTAAEIVAKWPVKRIATIAPDYAYGQDAAKAFVEHIKKVKPEVEIVDQQWPKLGEADYTPFINAQLGARPDAVFSALWGGHFLTFAKQAKPLKYFDAVNYNFIAAGEGASIESTRTMGPDYPVGIWGNAYDAFNWENAPAAHKDYISRLKAYTKEEYPSSWPITGYIGMQMLVEGIKKAGAVDSDKVAQALLDLTIDTPIGSQTLRAKDHQANRGQLWGKTVQDPKYPFAIMKDIIYIDPLPFMG